MFLGDLEERFRALLRPEKRSYGEFLGGGGLLVGLLALGVVTAVTYGTSLSITTPKGCEIAAWARNISRGTVFSSGSHWLGEVLRKAPPQTAAHYPPLPALLHSLPLELFGEGTFPVLSLSIVLFLGLPLWILTLGKDTDFSRLTLFLSAGICVFFPPLVSAGFQPDGEILLAWIGAVSLAGMFRARTPLDFFWIGLLGGTALTVSLDAPALGVSGVVAAWFGSKELKADGSVRLFRYLVAGWIPGLAALVGFLLLSNPEGFSVGGFWRELVLLGSDRGLGIQRSPIVPASWVPPSNPGGWIGTFLDGLSRHSAAAVGTVPVWCWGVLVIALLTGGDSLRGKIAVSLAGWAAVWGGRAFRYGEVTEAFTLFSVGLLILAVETLVRILETLSRYRRITPPMKTAAIGTLVLVTWWPGFFRVREIRNRMDPDRVRLENLWAERIEGVTEPDELLLTDTPEQLAWKTGRRTVWLPATPNLLKTVTSDDRDWVIVLSGAIESARDVDPTWWDLFETGSGVGEFTTVYLDPETYSQVWKRSSPQLEKR